MGFAGAGIWNGGDPALAATDPRKVDATATPGNVTVSASARSIRVKMSVGTSRLVITHPAITATSRVSVSYEGDTTVTPAATRRSSARPGAGTITVDISAGALATDGALVVTVGAL